jgi:hypothetical protein
MMAHAIGYSISGLKPWGFHLISILLHCANTLLLTLFGYRLTRDRFVSAAGGLLFALHPIHAESVAWIAGVTDPLCALFYFAALYVSINDDPAKGLKTGLLTSVLFLGALFSKEMAFTLPLVVVLLDVCFGRKLRWGDAGGCLWNLLGISGACIIAVSDKAVIYRFKPLRPLSEFGRADGTVSG